MLVATVALYFWPLALGAEAMMEAATEPSAGAVTVTELLSAVRLVRAKVTVTSVETLLLFVTVALTVTLLPGSLVVLTVGVPTEMLASRMLLTPSAEIPSL